MIKQVIIVRTDLNMRTGKKMAQAAHASMAFITNRLQFGCPIVGLEDNYITSGIGNFSSMEESWIKGSFTKIVVGAGSEQELRDLQKQAQEANIEAHLITDNGLTEFKGVPTVTALALGPDLAYKLDPITGHLKLL